MNNTMLSAFQTSAGVSPDKLSLLIRTLVLVITFIWAAWCVYGEIHHFNQHGVDIESGIRKLSRILLIVMLMIMLVFIK